MDIDIGGQPLQMRLDFTAATTPAVALEPVTLLVREWQRLRAIVTSPDRPCGREMLKEQARARLDEAAADVRQYDIARRSVPAAYAHLLDNACATAATCHAAVVDELNALERGTHPDVARLARWEAEHPDVDVQCEMREIELDSALRAWAEGPGRSWMPDLPASVSPAGAAMWRNAAAEQLAYREEYAIPVNDPAPLGSVTPWDPVQREQREAARLLLTEVGVEVDAPGVSAPLHEVLAERAGVVHSPTAELPQLEIAMPFPSPYAPGGYAVA